MKIYFATDDLKKFREITYLIPFPIELLNINIPEIQGSIDEISYNKAISTYQYINKDVVVMVECEALEIVGLNNFPGPYVNQFMRMGLDNIEKIVNTLGRNANAICSLTLCYKENNNLITKNVVGSVQGDIIKKRISNDDSNFESIFLLRQCNKTFGEMSFKEKIVVSHRGMASKKLIDLILHLGLK